MAEGTRVLLVRCGTTELAERGRLRGRSDVGLTSTGRAQAESLARSLRGLPVDRLLTSPLRRARQTAAAIGSALGVTPATQEQLIDVDAGRWTGLDDAEAMADDPVAFDRYRRFPQAAAFPNGESMPQAEWRLLDALSGLCGRGDRLVIIVSHELPIRLALARLRAYDGSWLWYPPLPPAARVEVEVDGRGVFLPTVLEGLFRDAERRVEDRWRR